MAGVSPHLKLHRFRTALDGKTYTVMTPRPALKSRFANNLFHGTRHILTDATGARFLSRIFWWLSYQRTPNSIVAITGEHLSPSPFVGDPPSPIAIFNSDLTHLSRAATDQLRTNLRRPPRSEGTVRVSTPSLQEHATGRDEQLMAEHWQTRSHDFSLTDRTNGVVRVTANPDLLRWWSIWLNDLGSAYYSGADHRYLSGTQADRYPEGEVQIFRHFDAMVRDAVALREQLFPGTAHRELTDDERHTVLAQLPKAHADRSSS